MKKVHKVKYSRLLAWVSVVLLLLAAAPIVVFASGQYDITSIYSVVGVNGNGQVDVFERANIPAVGTSPSVDFFIPSKNYTGQSKPLTGKEVAQGHVILGKAACFYKDNEDLGYTLSPVLAPNTYTIAEGPSGDTVSLSPAPQDDSNNVYILSYSREGSITRYQDAAVLDFVLVSSGEYGGAIGQAQVILQFASAVNADEFTVYVHGTNQVEWAQGDPNSIGIIAHAIPAGGLLEVRILMPLSLVPQCTQTVSAQARPLVLAQEGSPGIPPAAPDPLIPWLYPLYAFAAWLLVIAAVYAVYRRKLYAPSKGFVHAPPSDMAPALASRLLSPMGMDASVLLSVFLDLVREGFLDLACEADEKGRTAFRFKRTRKDSVLIEKYKKEVLEWIFEHGDYEGVTDRELKRLSLRKPGAYYDASLDVLISATNEATDAGLLRDAPAVYRYLWVVIALALAAMAVVPMFWGVFEPLILLVPAFITLIIRQYTRKVPSMDSIQPSAQWRAYAAWLASGAKSDTADLGVVESDLLYATAFGSGKKFVQKLDGLEVPKDSSRLLSPFTCDGRFSGQLFGKLLYSFQAASFFSAFLRSSPIRAMRKEVTARMKKK